MKKKLAVIIMAFIMMISGCSMALSQGEYYNRFSENYKAYNKNLLSLSAKLGDAESDPGSVDWDSFESDLKVLTLLRNCLRRRYTAPSTAISARIYSQKENGVRQLQR